jgi:hypothetical protein
MDDLGTETEEEAVKSRPAIAKIERVPLREVWRHEAHNLTTWLEENIDVLNDVVDLDLTNVEREQAAGSFSADLVAEDSSGGTVVIENQLERQIRARGACSRTPTRGRVRDRSGGRGRARPDAGRRARTRSSATDAGP